MSKRPPITIIPAIQPYQILDTPPEKEFDEIAELAAEITRSSVALIGFLHDDRLFFKAQLGVEISESSLAGSFFEQTINKPNEVVVINGVQTNERFNRNPLDAELPSVGFYAGISIVNPKGETLGLLSVLDQKTIRWSKNQSRSLKMLANQVAQLLELRKSRNERFTSDLHLNNETQRLKSIIEATNVGTWEWNVQTGELHINDRWAEIIGYTKEELEPINIDLWYKVLHPDDRERTDKEFEACFNREIVFYDAQCRMVHKDGHEVWINDRGTVVSWTDDGKPLWMMGTHTDITEEKNTEQQLLAISDNIPGAVFRFQLSPGGKDSLEMVSKGAYELWGVSPGEVMQDNSTVWKNFDKDDLERVRESIRASARTLGHWQCEWRYYHPNGSVCWHRGSGNPWRSEDGSTNWDAMILDVTEQKKAEIERDSYLSALEERIKERTVLYQIAQITNQQLPVDLMLQKTAVLMPNGWQYPEITSAKITYGKKSFKSDRFKKTKWSQSVQRLSESGKKLELTVAYSEKMPDEEDGPFLIEEWHLINNIADNLIINLNHHAVVEHNELILQSTREGIYGIDEKGACTFINNAAAQMLGYSATECLGQNMHDLIHHHTEDGAPYPEAACPIYKSRKVIEGCRVIDEVFWTKENNAIPVRYSSTPILVDGKFKGAVVVFNDISETKKAEKTLQLREKRYRALVENGADAIAILGTDGSTSYMSPSIARVLGYSENEALEFSLAEIMHPDDQPYVMAKMQESLENPEVPIRSGTMRAKHKNGSWRWVEATITNLLHDPAINGIVDNFRDVTERVEFEQSLKDSQEKYWSLFDTSPLPMWIYDLKTGEIIDANQTTTEKYGYSREEFLNLHITELRPESELPALNQVVKSAKKLKGTQRFGVFTHLKKNGELMRMDVSGHRLIYENKDSLLVVCNEVTESEAAFDALQASEARYRGFYESQTNYIIRTDMDGNYSYVNKKFEEDFGWVYPEGQLIGSDCLPSIKEYDQPKVFEVVEKCIQSPGKVHQVEIDKPTKTGDTATTLWDFICILNDTGEPVEIQCVGLDITHRINTEKALIESHERYELINRATNDAIYDWDVKKDRFVWGDGFYRMFGYQNKFETFRLEDWIRLTHPVDSAAHKEEWLQFMADENALKWENEFRFQRDDGSYAFVAEIGYMIRDSDGNPERMVGVLRDQTELKLAELQQDLLSNVAQRFKDSKDLDTTLTEVMRYITRFGKFSLAEIWMTSKDKKHLNRISEFARNKTFNAFFSESQRMAKMKKGEGLPGLTWKTNSLLTWHNVQSNKLTVRKAAAIKAQLHTMVGIPLTYNQETIGVLILGKGKTDQETEQSINLLGAIGPFLGAEIKRKQQEEELQSFFENAPEILAIATPNGYFSKVNPAFSEVLGYSAKELTTIPITDLIHPDDRGKTDLEYNKNLTGTRQADNFINRYQTKSGELRWISWTSSKPYGEDGEFFAYGRDITQIIKLQQLLENAAKLARIGSWEVDVKNNENYWSDITKHIHEVPEDFEPNLKEGINFYKEGWSREKISKAIELATQTGEPFDEELIIVTAKNNERWIRAIGRAEFLEGECIRIHGSFQDIHERKTAEIELEKAYEERNNILESIGDAFLAADNNWVVSYWNRQAEIVLGKRKDEVLGKVLWDQYEDAKSLKFYSEYHRAMETGKVVNFEEYYPGTSSWYEVSAYPSKKGLSVYFKDVTLRKKAHEQIRLTKERFEKVTQATNDAIWDFDVTKNELFWGQGFDTLFGYNPQKTLPTFELLLSKIHPADRDRVASKVEAYMKDSSAINWHEEYRFLKAGGTYAYVIDRAVFIRNAQGEVTRVVGAMTDISYRKEHEKSLKKLNEQLEKHAIDLERSNAELEQFAYIASHDLQEPLRMVTSFLNQLERKYNDQLDDKAQQYIYFAVDGARRMRQIILDLLEFSRVGRLEEKKTTIDLNQIIDDYCALRKSAIEENSAVIRYGNLPEVSSYKTPVTQVFHNLIDNAIKYARPGVAPEVRINSTDRGKYWEFEIRDNGIGIEEEYFEKIFVIFQRLHDKSEYSGSGMGLAIVRKIMDNLGGEIWLTSDPEKGSSFFFTLPKTPQL